MKNLFLKAILPVLAMAASLSATPEKDVRSMAPQYNHRMAVFHPAHVSYEYSKPADFYVHAKLYAACAKKAEQTVNLVSGEAMVGWNLDVASGTFVRPVVGVTWVREYSDTYATDFGTYRYYHAVRTMPDLLHGAVGVMAEHAFNDIFSVGASAKLLLGGPVGKKLSMDRDFIYGGEFALPVTIRFGATSHWDLRLEPFFVVRNDTVKYLSHRSAIAYRF